MITRQQLPNLLTGFRIAAIPLVVVFYLWLGNLGIWLAGITFITASITDYFDGHLARKWNVQSSFGRLLDPIADKLLVAGALMLLVTMKNAPLIASLIIVSREILVSGLREFLAERQIPMPVIALAKTKTGVQMTAISVLLLAPVVDPWLYWALTFTPLPLPAYPECTLLGYPPLAFIGTLLLWLAAGLTFITGYHYWRAGAQHID